MSRHLDPRVTPLRADGLAAEKLRGEVDADAFAAPQRLRVRAPSAFLRQEPDARSEAVNQVLFGEAFEAYDVQDRWVWGQSRADDYVGWAPREAFAADEWEPDYRVRVLRALVLDGPNVKAPALGHLSLNAHIKAVGERDGFIEAAGLGWLWSGALAPHDRRAPDWVAVCEMFEHAPYVWGGRDSLGVDCSGLVQAGLMAAGMRCPRDTDMQREALGAPLGEDALAGVMSGQGLERGDLVFWKGHVGVMTDGATLLHANAHHMMTATEPLAAAVARIAESAGPVIAVRRLP